jgi:anti-anti-sigma factor
VTGTPSIERTLLGGCLVGRVSGEMDYLTKTDFLALFDALVDTRPPSLVLDLSGVTFCDSAGLGALLAAQRIAKARDTVLALACAPPPLRRILELTGADQVLTLYGTVGDAVTAFGA